MAIEVKDLQNGKIYRGKVETEFSEQDTTEFVLSVIKVFPEGGEILAHTWDWLPDGGIPEIHKKYIDIANKKVIEEPNIEFGELDNYLFDLGMDDLLDDGTVGLYIENGILRTCLGYKVNILEELILNQ